MLICFSYKHTSFKLLSGKHDASTVATYRLKVRAKLLQMQRIGDSFTPYRIHEAIF